MGMITRREALARLGGLVAGGLITGRAGAESTTGSAASNAGVVGAGGMSRGKEFTAAHITDIHIYDERHAQKWFAECLHHVQSNPAKPSFVINTGDCVMDSLKVDRARADQLWKLWRDVLQNDNSLAVKSCLGNHDVWGLALKAGDPAKKDSMYGKKLGMDGLGLARPYYSFDHGDWHFIALDSIHPDADERSGWISQLDDEQFEWLKADLKATPDNTPVAVFSHIPILQVCTMVFQKPGEDNGYSLSPHGMLGDARRIIDLFAKHPNVKLCLSGHMHLNDRIELSGVTYICDGSVCGRWWKGSHHGSKPGYSTITFKPDGTFDHNYGTYGWKLDESETSDG